MPLLDCQARGRTLSCAAALGCMATLFLVNHHVLSLKLIRLLIFGKQEPLSGFINLHSSAFAEVKGARAV